MSWLGGEEPGGGKGFGEADYPWWAAEEETTADSNVTDVDRCQSPTSPHYSAVKAILSAMFLVFGIAYITFGYRCFKAVMFLTGFIFASVIVYFICLTEDLLPLLGNVGVALGAGIMFGLITMLVQYVGLFMTGFHTGLFLGVASIVAASPWWMPSSVWAVVGILLCTGLLLAISTLYFQKGLTVLGTSISGGAIMAATLDYFVEEFEMVRWFIERLKGSSGTSPCWFSWIVLGVWPFMVFVGTLFQWRVSGKGIYHQQSVTRAHSRNVNLHRIRSREARAEMRQKKYRYLYQVRTAHGDIISQVNMPVCQVKRVSGLKYTDLDSP